MNNNPETEKNLHVFTVLVEDTPGVLNRVASLFRRRNYNIASLSVGQTHEPGLSRMTIRVEADDDTARRFEADLYKLVNVLHVEDITYEPSVMRAIALIKVDCTHDERPDVVQICQIFRARVVDVSPASLIAEITGTQTKIESLLSALRPYRVTDMVRSGAIAMCRGRQSKAPGALEPPSHLAA